MWREAIWKATASRRPVGNNCPLKSLTIRAFVFSTRFEINLLDLALLVDRGAQARNEGVDGDQVESVQILHHRLALLTGVTCNFLLDFSSPSHDDINEEVHGRVESD